MKKSLVLTLLFVLVLSVSLFATGTSRVYSQNLYCTGGTGLIDSYIQNTSATTNANYRATATISSDPTALVTTGISPIATIRVNRVGTTFHYVVINIANISTTTPYATGDVVHVTLTWIGAAPYTDQMTQWDLVLPAGTAGITQNTPAQLAPPLLVDSFGVPTIVAPLDGAIDVPHGTVTLDWAYTTGAGIITPTGYWLKTAATQGDLATAVPTYHVDSFFDVFLGTATTLWWQVAATTDTAPGKGLPATSRAKATSRASGAYSAAWHFTTDNPVTGYDVQVNSNEAALIYDGGISTGFRAPHLFAGIQGTHTFSVETITTMVTPGSQEVTGAATLTFTYTNIPGTSGGGNTTVVAGPVTVPTTVPGVTLSGVVNGGGLMVVTQVTPAAKGSYAGYIHVANVYQVWVSDTSILDNGSLTLNFPEVASRFVGLHWGAYYPAYGPNYTPGYAFAGGISTSGFQLGIAPFEGSSGTPGSLSILSIPVYAGKGPGTFEFILSEGDQDLPVELSSFSAVATAQMFVNLQWTTESETNNLGFNVFRSNSASVSEANQVNFGIINGTNSSTTHNYNFVDNSVDPETTYYYWLQMVDFDGTSHFSNSVMVTTQSPNTPPPTPNTTVLRSAYPNPFNVHTSTNIEMDVKTGETATLSIYNVLGQIVKTYVRPAGSHKITWNGTDDKGAVCGSGIYFYKLSSPSVNATKKMVIVK